MAEMNITLLLEKELEDVRAFHKKMGFLIFTRPGHLTQRKLEERIRCLREELTEFEEACKKQDLVAQADALVDMAYFIKGTVLMLGLPWLELWDAVHSANMNKVPGGKVREGVLHPVCAVKPEGWQPPDIEKILASRGYRPEQARRECQRDDPNAEQGFGFGILTPELLTEKFIAANSKLMEERFWELRRECIDKALKLAGPTGQGRKSSDYNDGGVNIIDYAVSGAADSRAGFFPDIWKKTLRLKSLFAKQRRDGEKAVVNNEPIEDNLVDLLNYVSFEYAMFALYKEVGGYEVGKG